MKYYSEMLNVYLFFFLIIKGFGGLIELQV